MKGHNGSILSQDFTDFARIHFNIVTVLLGQSRQKIRFSFQYNREPLARYDFYDSRLMLISTITSNVITVLEFVFKEDLGYAYSTKYFQQFCDVSNINNFFYKNISCIRYKYFYLNRENISRCYLIIKHFKYLYCIIPNAVFYTISLYFMQYVKKYD